MLVLSFGLTQFFGTQFFPPAERNQMLIDIELPGDGVAHQPCGKPADEVMAQLKQHEEIVSAALFSGGTAPRFYYNVEPRPPANNLAQILVNTRTQEDVPPLLVKLRAALDKNVVGARCIVKQLEQGPPIGAPIQVRFSGENLDVLRGLADQGAAAIRGGRWLSRLRRSRLSHAEHFHRDRSGPRELVRHFQSTDRANLASRLRWIANHAIARRRSHHPGAVRLRIEERNEAEKIRALYVHSANNQPVPFASFADIKVEPEFAIIPHFNQLRAVTVNSYVPAGEFTSALLARARPALAAIKFAARLQSRSGRRRQGAEERTGARWAASSSSHSRSSPSPWSCSLIP